MNTKLKHLISGSDMTEGFRMCFFDCSDPIDENKSDILKAKIPWIPETYLDLLKISDGMTFEFFVIYSSAELWDRQYPLADYGGNKKYVCLGHDSSGDAFVADKDGKIYYIPTDPPPNEPLFLCENFEYLIDRIFCGPEYVEYFGGRENVEGQSEWYDYLVKNKWA